MHYAIYTLPGIRCHEMTPHNAEATQPWLFGNYIILPSRR